MKHTQILSYTAGALLLPLAVCASITNNASINGSNESLTWYQGVSGQDYSLNANGVGSMTITTPTSGTVWNQATAVLSTPLSLTAGQPLQLSFDVSNMVVDGQYNVAFSFGLFNSANQSATLAADGNPNSINAHGYKAALNPIPGNNPLLSLYKRIPEGIQSSRSYLLNGHFDSYGTGLPSGGTTGSNIGTSQFGSSPIQDFSATYHFIYTLTLLNEDELLTEVVFGKVDGDTFTPIISNSYTETDSIYISSLSDIDVISFGLWHHNSNKGITEITISNIELSTIPEPASAAIILGIYSVISLAALRRRSKQS